MRYPAVCTGNFLASRTMLPEPADYVTIGRSMLAVLASFDTKTRLFLQGGGKGVTS
jgi:hypothetical protein